VISNCDARQTFFDLLDKSNNSTEFAQLIETMIPSLSTFVIYLGIDDSYEYSSEKRSNLWFMDTYDLDGIYSSASRGDFDNIGRYLLHIVPKKNTIQAYFNTSFKSESYWAANKEYIFQAFIKKIETTTMPELSRHIIYKGAATPYTLYKYTLNHNGAAYGWASTPSQLGILDFKKPSFVKGLYLTGHWTTQGLGIPGVAYAGYDTARIVLKREKHRKQLCQS
jgi:phytoene dehydrogenase-like protein